MGSLSMALCAYTSRICLIRVMREFRIDRQLHFKHLGGRNREDVRRLKLADDVSEEIKKKKCTVDDAVQNVAEKYGIDERSVWDAWGQYCSLLKGLSAVTPEKK
jgi:hypothetical protein